MKRADTSLEATDADKAYELGSRLLYLHTPYFQGEDVSALQTALEALGFSCGGSSGIFDAYTEGALRRFQINMGLDADGIAGMETYATIERLKGAWKEKNALENRSYMSFARASEVLEAHPVCIFGTNEFTRLIASNISNLALATNPYSRILSAEHMPVVPTATTLLLQIVTSEDASNVAVDIPRVRISEDTSLSERLADVLSVVHASPEYADAKRIAVEVTAPTAQQDALRVAHHIAIDVLDALCIAYSQPLS